MPAPRPAADGSLAGRSATELARMIREGHATSAAVVDAHLERIARVNPGLNALVLVDADGARERARAADRARARGESWGPLHGVPFTAKDAFETAGMRTTCGAGSLRDHVPARDAPAVRRLREAGAVLLGKTNVPAYTSDYQTDNRLFGRTLNPWDAERTPGGSSGGGAAAVAAGLTPLEVASDVGGSIRLPAHYCGVPGLKPTNRRIPMTGHVPPRPGEPRGLRNLAAVGLIARGVADLRTALSACQGPDGADCTAPPVPLARSVQRRPEELRLAWTPGFSGLPLEPELSAAAERWVAALTDAGARVERVSPEGLDLEEMAEVYGALFGAELGSTRPERPEDAARLREMRDGPVAEPYTRGYAQGFDATVARYTAWLHRRDEWIRRMEAVLAGHDAWIWPVAPTAAPAHRRPGEPIRVEGRAWPYLAQGWYCLPCNLTDHPALALPVGWTEEGLPVSVQLVGGLWRDAELLDVAACAARVAEPAPRPAPLVPA